MDPAALLDLYVERHNRGVRTGAFTDLLLLFSPDAEMRFEGVPFGPLTGREAIAEAFRTRPPDDELRLLAPPAPEDGGIAAPFRWRRRPRDPGGVLHASVSAGRIDSLLVRAGEGVERPRDQRADRTA